jgi:hypothetical protein
MRMRASWSGSLRPTEYKVATRSHRVLQRAPLAIVVPTTLSGPSGSELSRHGLAMMRVRGNVGATASLARSCARRQLRIAGRGEETGFQVEQGKLDEEKK